MVKLPFSHIAMSCQDPTVVEEFYCRHFGFRRARVYAPGPQQVVMIRSGNICLELFPAGAVRIAPHPEADGPQYPGWRHIAFLVNDLDIKLAEMGEDVRLTLGPLDMSEFIPGMRAAWLADPEGNIVELNQGYVDDENPPQR